MQLKWNDGIYDGQVANGMPHGNGVLTLKNGLKRGFWQKGTMVQGMEYVDDVLFVGNYDQQGNYHGKGYYEKENVLTWRGEWEHGKIVKDDFSSTLPNCVFVGQYYGGIEPKNLSEWQFPQKGKIGRSGYFGMRVDADHYEMPLLSNAFGMRIVCAVEKPNNRYGYSGGYNKRALHFCQPNSKNMHTDAWVLKWENGDYAPLTPQEAFDINNFIHEALAYEKIEDFAQTKQKFANRKFLLLDQGIYKGDLDKQGNPNGDGWIVFNHDDKQGRALYKGSIKNGKPDGYGEMFWRGDAENCHYKGLFKEGLFHTTNEKGQSKASLVKNNGQDWYGVWVNGEFEGDDNAIALGGWAYERYDGKFVKSQLVHGTHSNPNHPQGKYRYEGDFLNFLPHGYGTETINDVSWKGYFVRGKRLVGDGDSASKNTVELMDPFVLRKINVKDFCKTAFALQMATEEQLLQIVCNEKVAQLQKQVGDKIVLICANQQGVANNSFAKALFDVDVTGSCLLCHQKDDGSFDAIPPNSLINIATILTKQTEVLQSQNASTEYTVTTLDDKHSSDWDVTRETHDDYPLEANHDFYYTAFLLVQLGKQCFYGIFNTLTSYEWTANSNDETFEFANASLKLHKIPDGMTNHQQIKDYCQKQNKWTQEEKSQTIRSSTGYKAICDDGGFLPMLINKLMGAKLNKID